MMRRMVLVGFGLIVGLIGVTLSTAGAWLLWAQGTQRDADGYYTSPPLELRSDGYAITAGSIELAGTGGPGGWTPDVGALATRVSVAPVDEGAQVFVGVAAEDDLDRYLRDAAHAEVSGVDGAPASATYRPHAGTARPAPPVDQDIWVASAQGSGRQTLEWTTRKGRWAVAVMNADASPDVEITAVGGVRAGGLTPVAGALLVTGVVLVSGAALLFVLGVRHQAPQPAVARPHVTSP
jgi:hypothetical protein